MSEIEYIEIPIETDPEELSQESFAYLQSKINDWVPNDANLETIFVEALARLSAEARDVASAVPTDIFRFYGELVGIEVQEAEFATTTMIFTVVDDLGYTIPAGTQVGIRLSGSDLVIFETVSDAIVDVGDTTVTDVLVQAIEAGEAANGLDMALPVEMIDSLIFVSNVGSLADTGGGLEAETTQDYLNRLTGRLRLLADRPILPNDYSIMALDINGVERATSIDGYNPNHNLLSANQSSLETDTTGWEVGANCTIARVTSPAGSDGLASLRLQSVAGGSMHARTPTALIAALPGQYWTAFADFRTAVSVRQCRTTVIFYNAAGSVIGSGSGAQFADSTSAWIQSPVASAIAPALTAWVGVTVDVLSTGGASEQHYVDRIALKHYAGTGFGIGGTVEYNNERMITVFPTDSLGQPVSIPIRNELDAYLQSLREVTFVVWIADPTYTFIDVTFAAKAFPNYSIASVEAAAEQAVADYLDPANWGVPTVQNISVIDTAVPNWINQPVLRYLELTTVINNVPGIDYVSSLTFGRTGDTLGTADITLSGPAPMTDAGIIAGTVT